MSRFKQLTPVSILVLALLFTISTIDPADARSKRGGRKFKPAPKQTQATHSASQASHKKKSGSFMKGLAGGLLGGALGAFLFGSMMGGDGIGLLPILLFAGLGFFLFRRLSRARQHPGAGAGGFGGAGPAGGTFGPGSGVPGEQSLDQGLDSIRKTDPLFDPSAFLETASDCFFQVQAGWMRRDLASYRNLLGDQLAAEYAETFARMEQEGVINKLESIAIRNVKPVAAGSTGGEDFITVLFKANLLDYTVNEQTGEVVDGSETVPVKFEEEWTFARPVGTGNWRLEGIEVVKE